MRIAIIGILASIMLGACTAKHTSIFRTYDLEGSENRSVLIDAKQRAILSVERESVDRETRKREKIRKFCAEPSPDALSAISTSFATSLSVGVAGQGEGAAALGAALSEAASQLGRRNATIRLLRDGFYRLCEASLNESISKTQYNLLASKLTNSMVVLLGIEQLTPSEVEELRITTGGNTSVTVNTELGGGESPPEGETPQPEGETPPPEGETPPPEGETPPPEGETPPPEGETPAPNPRIVRVESRGDSEGGLLPSGPKYHKEKTSHRNRP